MPIRFQPPAIIRPLYHNQLSINVLGMQSDFWLRKQMTSPARLLFLPINSISITCQYQAILLPKFTCMQYFRAQEAIFRAIS